MSTPVYIPLPHMCAVFARAHAAYEAHKALPCPKDGFSGWGEVNEFMETLAALLSKTAGVELRWDATPNLEENIRGELGKFEVKERR